MKYYVVDAFTDTIFRGNPAGVCLLDAWLEDATMQSIAAENNLAETAFVVPQESGYGLRWFTPEVEMDLCGHATLASAFVLANFVDKDIPVFRFHTQSGELIVTKNGNLFELDFPARPPKQVDITPMMKEAIGVPVLEAHLARDLILLVENEAQVANLTPSMNLLSQIPNAFSVVVTAKGENADFVSRFFAPNAGIPEDPVTGSSHCTLIPFWSKRLGKADMLALQLSKRGGALHCQDCGERVKIAGNAALYLVGEICVSGVL